MNLQRARIAHLQSGAGQAEVRDFCIPLFAQQQIVRFHVLMNQMSFGLVCVMQASGKLNRNIQQPLLHFFICAFI